jgi:hypothetical protein
MGSEVSGMGVSFYLLMFAAVCGFGWWARGHADDVQQ